MKRTSRFSASFVSLVLILACVAGVGLLSGCGTAEKNVAVDQQPNERRIGVLKSLGGVRTSNQGTHLLSLDDGDTILLSSTAINLDDPMYLGKMVEVRGAITYTTDNKQLMEVMNIDVIQEAPTQQLAELKWETYDNASAGFSMKYRSDMKVSEKDGSVNFEKMPDNVDALSQEMSGESEETTLAANAHVLMITAVSPGTKTYLEWLQSEFSGLKSDSSTDLLAAGLSKSKVGASSLDAVKHTEGAVAEYYVNAGKTFYKIHIDSGSDSSSLSDQNLFYDMLSSFTTGSSPAASQELEVVEVGGDTNISSSSGSTSSDTSTSTTTPSKNLNFSDSSFDSTSTNTSGSSTTTTTTTTTTPTPPTPPSSTSTTQPPSTTVTSDTSSSSTTSSTGTTEIAGYTKLESDSFNFSMQFPKSWYYAGETPTESGVLRHYDFGDKPLDEQTGSVSLDVMSGSVPSGSSVSVNGKTLTKVTNGDSVEYYYQGDGTRVYRVSGPASSASTLATMASSVEE